MAREQKSGPNNKLEAMKHLLRRPTAASHFWACDDDTDFSWCAADEPWIFKAASNTEVGLRVALIVFASSFILTVLCTFL